VEKFGEGRKKRGGKSNPLGNGKAMEEVTTGRARRSKVLTGLKKEWDGI